MTGTLLSAGERAVDKVKFLPHRNDTLFVSVCVCL